MPPPWDDRRWLQEPSAEQRAMQEHLLSLPPVEVRVKKLHWLQWWAYSMIIITCVALLFTIYDVYQIIFEVQKALANWGKG